jgi:hypothetical protein
LLAVLVDLLGEVKQLLAHLIQPSREPKAVLRDGLVNLHHPVPRIDERAVLEASIG